MNKLAIFSLLLTSNISLYGMHNEQITSTTDPHKQLFTTLINIIKENDRKNNSTLNGLTQNDRLKTQSPSESSFVIYGRTTLTLKTLKKSKL